MDSDSSSSGAVAPWLDNVVTDPTQQVGSASQSASHRYGDFTLENSQAVFGNVDKSTHNHYYSIGSTSKRRRGSNESVEVEREAKTYKQDLRSALIKSLSFDGMWDRHSQIVNAYAGTCEWILSDRLKASRFEDLADAPAEEEEEHDTDNANDDDTDIDEAEEEEGVGLAKWLQSDEDFFWIRGSAGSGKSTLVSYITQHESEVRANWATWAGDRQLVFASFFFWRYGKFMQKSIHGMLRTLLVQVLQQVPEHAWSSNNSSALPSIGRQSFIADRPWSQSQLLELLRNIIRESRCKFCFFIDALDEFHAYDTHDQLSPHEAALKESMHDLLDSIKSFQITQDVKVCVASRPGNVFDVAFHHIKPLDLERLNAHDIDVYTLGKLGQWMDQSTIRDLTIDLQDRARGIFLWVKLAVDSLIEGLENGDDKSELMARLDEMPAGLDAMYKHMLQKLDPRYVQDSNLIFNLVLEYTDRFDTSNACALLIFLWRRHISSLGAGSEIADFSESTMRRLLQSRTCGLLCLGLASDGEDDEDAEDDEDDEDDRWTCSPQEMRKFCLRIRFIHRSAQDFIHRHQHLTKWHTHTPDDHLYPQQLKCNKAFISSAVSLFGMLPQESNDVLSDLDLLTPDWLDFKPFPQSMMGMLYLWTLKLLSESRHLGWPVSRCEAFLERFSALQIKPDCEVLETLSLGLDDLSASLSAENPSLSHMVHFAINGFEEYVKAASSGFKARQPLILAYLLYWTLFAILWLRGEHATSTPHLTDSGRTLYYLRDWTGEIQFNLGQTAKGTCYLERTWMTFLTATTRVEARGSSLAAYQLLLQAAQVGMSFQRPIRLFMSNDTGFVIERGNWELTVGTCFLLQPRWFDEYQRDGFDDAFGRYSDRMGSTDLNPQECEPKVVNMHDQWLRVSAPISVDQSMFIDIGQSNSTWFDKPQWGEVGLNRLRWVMVYVLAQLSNSLHVDVTWTKYLEKVKSQVRQYDYQAYRDFTRSRAQIQNKPCLKDACWDCVCKQAQAYIRCDARCKCGERTGLLYIGSDATCDTTCEGCNCTRKVYNKWLRLVLKEDELDWDNWYDVLIERYGLREEALRPSKH